jgi:hypothetical protein
MIITPRADKAQAPKQTAETAEAPAPTPAAT